MADYKIKRAENDNKDFIIVDGELIKYKGKDSDVVVPDGVTAIGGCAFDRCHRLMSVTIPEGVTRIGGWAFSGCYDLADIKFPSSLKEIEADAFKMTKWLENQQNENPLVIVNGILIDGIKCQGVIIVPDGVTCIGERSFEECINLTGITIPDSVMCIGKEAFRDCKRLTHITIPDRVTSIGEQAFSGCRELSNISIPSKVTSIANNTFSCCNSLTDVTIPNGVTSIGEWAFFACSNLTSIEIPDSVTCIGESAFDSCKKLTSITIPNSVTSLGRWAFRCCENLADINIPDSVASIGAHAFAKTKWLEKKRSESPLVIVNGILQDGEECEGDIIIPEGVTCIGDQSFDCCAKLTVIAIPNSVTSIGYSAFNCCEGLTDLTIPGSVTRIGQSAFYNCSNLNSISISAGVKSIGNWAFKSCEKLTSITIPSSVMDIGNSAFECCENLTSLTITNGAVNIGENVFRGCKNLSVLDSLLLPDCSWMPSNSFVLIVPGDKCGYYAFASKTDSQNLIGSVDKGIYPTEGWTLYDLELINNGPTFKHSLIDRLVGALGRLMDPVELSDDNRTLLIAMINKNLKKLFAFAESIGRAEMIRDLLSLNILEQKSISLIQKLISESDASGFAALADVKTEAAVPTKPEQVSKNKVPKLSAIKRVELLEQKVLDNDIEGVRAVFRDYQPIEFTARALGLACRCSGAEMVKTLIECGASFKFEDTPALKRKYNCSIKLSNYRDEPVLYELGLLKDTYAWGFDNEIIDAKERAKVIDVLYEKKEGSLYELLYYAILYSEDEIYEELIKVGVDHLTGLREGVVAGTTKTYHERYEFDLVIHREDGLCLAVIFERLLSCMNGDRIAIYPRNLYGYGSNSGFLTKFCADKLFDVMVKHTDMVAKTKVWELLEAIIEQNNASAMKYALEEKWISDPKDINKLMKLVNTNDHVSPELVGYVIEAQHNSGGMIDEIDLSLDPKLGSAANLKAIWGTKRQEDGTLIITSYKGDDKAVIIPSVIGKSTVTAVAPSAFDPGVERISKDIKENRIEITSIVVPGTIKSVSLPSSVKNNLKKVVLEEGIVEIDDFSGRNGIQEIVIPDSVKKLGDYAFSGCSSLKKITIPKHIKKIPDYFFAHTGFDDFVVDDHITSMGEGVFEGCENLKSVKLSDKMTKISMCAFYECSHLQSVEIPNTVTSIGTEAFLGCRELSSIVITDGIKIGDAAFSGCDALADENGNIIVAGNYFGIAWSQDDIRKTQAVILKDNVSKICVPLEDLPVVVSREYKGEGANIDVDKISVGDQVCFGRFPLNDDYIMQPLKWKVLAKEDGQALLMTVDCIMSLDYKVEQRGTWADSKVREMLNNGFFDVAFTKEEKEQIVTVNVHTPKNKSKGVSGGPDTMDKVFLLSMEEVEKYLPKESERKCHKTKYADKQDESKASFWQLRTPGKGWGSVAVNCEYGSYSAMTGNHVGSSCVRPVVWVK